MRDETRDSDGRYRSNVRVARQMVVPATGCIVGRLRLRTTPNPRPVE
jgi:hypothetical protein